MKKLVLIALIPFCIIASDGPWHLGGKSVEDLNKGTATNIALAGTVATALLTDVAPEAAYAAGYNAVAGASAAAGETITAGAIVVKGAVIAAAPYVAAGVVVGAAAYGIYEYNRPPTRLERLESADLAFGRCLQRNRLTPLCSEGFPAVCKASALTLSLLDAPRTDDRISSFKRFGLEEAKR